MATKWEQYETATSYRELQTQLLKSIDSNAEHLGKLIGEMVIENVWKFSRERKSESNGTAIVP